MHTTTSIDADMQSPCGIADTGIVHGKVNNLFFHTLLTGTIFILKLKTSTTGLTVEALMTGASQSMFFNRVCLLTKRAFYINRCHQALLLNISETR